MVKFVASFAMTNKQLTRGLLVRIPETHQEDSELVFLPLLLQVPDLLSREVGPASVVGAVDVAHYLRPEPVEGHY